jgi:hypothetical protein
MIGGWRHQNKPNSGVYVYRARVLTLVGVHRRCHQAVVQAWKPASGSWDRPSDARTCVMSWSAVAQTPDYSIQSRLCSHSGTLTPVYKYILRSRFWETHRTPQHSTASFQGFETDALSCADRLQHALFERVTVSWASLTGPFGADLGVRTARQGAILDEIR